MLSFRGRIPGRRWTPSRWSLMLLIHVRKTSRGDGKHNVEQREFEICGLGSGPAAVWQRSPMYREFKLQELFFTTYRGRILFKETHSNLSISNFGV